MKLGHPDKLGRKKDLSGQTWAKKLPCTLVRTNFHEVCPDKISLFGKRPIGCIAGGPTVWYGNRTWTAA